jgi:hypothetical protein
MLADSVHGGAERAGAPAWSARSSKMMNVPFFFPVDSFFASAFDHRRNCSLWQARNGDR